MPSNGGFGIGIGGKSFFSLNSSLFTVGNNSPSTTFSIGAAALIGAGTDPLQVAVSPDNFHVFVTNYTSSNLSVFYRDITANTLTEIVGSPFLLVGTLQGVSVSPDGLHVFVLGQSSKNVTVFSRNRFSGFLTPVAGSPFALIGTPTRVISSIDGAHVYILTGSIEAFSRNSTTGFLTAIAGSPFAAGGSPADMAISNDNTHIYITNNGDSTVSAFIRNGTTGALTPAIGSPFLVAAGTQPLSLAVTPDGLHVVVSITIGINNVFVFSRNAATGKLTLVYGPFASAAGTPTSVVASPDNTHIFIIDSNGKLRTYLRDSSNGALTLVATSDTGPVPKYCAVSPDGLLVFSPSFTTNNLAYFYTGSLTKYNLITASFDSSSGLGGSVNINGGLFSQGLPVLNVSLGDGRYASIAGLNTLPFSASALKVSEVANGKQGVATLVAGTVIVANTSITATSRIILTPQETGLFTGSLRVSARTVGTSFTILSTVLTDTAKVAYEIFEPG